MNAQEKLNTIVRIIKDEIYDADVAYQEEINAIRNGNRRFGNGDTATACIVIGRLYEKIMKVMNDNLPSHLTNVLDGKAPPYRGASCPVRENIPSNS